MKKAFLLICIISLAFLKGYSVDNPLKTGMEELVARENMPNFFDKALRGDTVRVAYLGGSITAQNGWRVFSLEWFKQRFPKAVLVEINAAIGGTGSDFGVFRLHDQVLKYNPDLLFVEFAVNDSKTADDRVSRAMEGIVRQTWQADASTDICFIYTTKSDFLEGKAIVRPQSQIIMEKVADYYGIPSIYFGLEVMKMINDGQLIVKGSQQKNGDTLVFSPDGVHPYPETGHKIYQKVLQRSFETMIGEKSFKKQKHKLSSPLNPDYFAHTTMVGLQNVNLSLGWEILETKDVPEFSGFRNFLHEVGKAGPGGELAFRFKGTSVGIFDLIGPGSIGKISVEIDGEVRDTLTRFDKYSTYWRLSYFVIDQLADQEHEVAFKALSTPVDKAAILSKKAEDLQKEEKYDQSNWYVGKILIDGHLLKY